MPNLDTITLQFITQTAGLFKKNIGLVYLHKKRSYGKFRNSFLSMLLIITLSYIPIGPMYVSKTALALATRSESLRVRSALVYNIYTA